jgi:hypothetical protein
MAGCLRYSILTRKGNDRNAVGSFGDSTVKIFISQEAVMAGKLFASKDVFLDKLPMMRKGGPKLFVREVVS